MKAVVFQEPRQRELREVEVPQPSAHEVLVRVRSTTLCATDMKVFEGRFAGVTYPHIPGHEFSGDIVGVGDAVQGLQEGMRVGVEVHVGCGQCDACVAGYYTLCAHYGQREWGHAHVGFTINGGLAEFVAVPARACHVLPDRVTFDQGAFTDNVGIALWAIERAHLRPGERVLIIGPGAIGLLALQLAADAAGRVVLAGTREGRLALGYKLGADAVVNVQAHTDPGQAIRDALGGSADAVIEFAGSESAARLALASVRRGGRVVLGGATGQGVTLNLDLSTIVRGHLDVLGSLANPQGVSARGLDLIARGSVTVTPLITSSLRLDEFDEAWHRFFEVRDDTIRVMLHPGEGDE